MSAKKPALTLVHSSTENQKPKKRRRKRKHVAPSTRTRASDVYEVGASHRLPDERRFLALDWIKNLELSSRDKVILFTLAAQIYPKEGCRITQKRLAHEAGLKCLPTLRARLNELERLGHITILRPRTAENPRKFCLYKLNVPVY